MVFKTDWEKTSQEFLPPVALLEQMVLMAFPGKKLGFYELIKGGCANLNIKIQVAGENTPFILRIYIRDKDSAFREQQLAKLLKDSIPIPLVYYLGDVENYRFAMTEFMHGITLRDLLLGAELLESSNIMFEVGRLLAKIAAVSFPKAGFFDKTLNIISETSKNDLLDYAKACLKDNSVVSKLSNENISSITYYLDKYGSLFPDNDQKNLVHGDFDPANILVEQTTGSWKVSGILDWEFSFSGSVLWDVANMLRYAHKMPKVFKDTFLNGLKQGGVILPENYQIIVLMLNLVSILDLLKRANSEKSPIQVEDLQDLIFIIVSELNAT